MTRKLPVLGSSAANTVFCSERVEGPWYPDDDTDFLWLDGNGKITAANGTLAEPKPNALSLVQIDDCPGSTPTCRASCYVHGLEKDAPSTHALYRHNSKKVREIVDEDHGLDLYAEMWSHQIGDWIAANARGGFRWHVSGDVLNKTHARWISAVCERSPKVDHWIYTRSFAFVGELGADNLAVNLSADRDNFDAAVACAEDWPGTRLCYLVTEAEIVDDPMAVELRLARLRRGDVIFPDYALRDGTEIGRQWFAALPSWAKQEVCPVDYAGKDEKRRCGPCPKCLFPAEVAL